MRERLKSALPSLVGLGLFVVALEVLRRELHAVTWHALTAAVVQTPASQLAAAIGLTVLGYIALTGYDFIAFAYLGRTISRWRIAVTSFLAYAIANNVGFAMLSGTSVRFRFYSRWGVTAPELGKIVFSYSVTFWLGLFALGGASLLASPLPDEAGFPFSRVARPAGAALLLLSFVYVAAAALRRKPLRFGRFTLPMPNARIALAQLAVSSIDWALAAAVLFVLLPSSAAPFPTVLGAFLVAQLLGLASHVPGGIGVFEGLMVLLLKPYLSSAELLPALVVYRAVYYLLPLSMALVALVGDEIRLRGPRPARVAAFFGRASDLVTPKLLAVFAFLGGVMLLFSGATPAAQGRLAWLAQFLPLGVIETSHFLGSLAGVLLLLFSQGLARRLDAAYYMSVAVVILGIAASLFKGLDFEEAGLLLLFLAILIRVRPAFDRKAAFFETRFSPTWIAAVIAAVVTSVWLGMFAFKHVEYSQDLWWQFERDAEASRFLRASVGAATAVLLFAVARLLRHAPHETPVPTQKDLEDAAAVIAKQSSTYAYLAYLRDKALLFNEQRTAFVMYAVQGRTWVALGDPVGPTEDVADLVRGFLELADDFGGTPVFYEVSKDCLHHYADFGLTFVKLGEEARVDLRTFTLEGGGRASKYRQSVRHLEKEGATFRMIPPAGVPAVLGELEAVSNDWLRHKSAAEKGFSLGFFDPEYLARFPIAVIEKEGRIVAFANVWPGCDKEELSIDLMRFREGAPKGVMEALFIHLMIWGRDVGYKWFALGMAPMSGFEESPAAPLWTRIGLFLYEHGDSVYNFQGLRAYKEKFDPLWEPHYLAYPGGLKLPRVLADVSALIAGGYHRIFRRG